MEKKNYEEIESRIDGLLLRMAYSDGSKPSEVNHFMITKVQTDEYIGQSNVSMKVFLRSSGKSGNNKPLTFKADVKKGFVSKFCEEVNWLRDNYDPMNEDIEVCIFCGEEVCEC